MTDTLSENLDRLSLRESGPNSAMSRDSMSLGISSATSSGDVSSLSSPNTSDAALETEQHSPVSTSPSTPRPLHSESPKNSRNSVIGRKPLDFSHSFIYDIPTGSKSDAESSSSRLNANKSNASRISDASILQNSASDRLNDDHLNEDRLNEDRLNDGLSDDQLNKDSILLKGSETNYADDTDDREKVNGTDGKEKYSENKGVDFGNHVSILPTQSSSQILNNIDSPSSEIRSPTTHSPVTHSSAANSPATVENSIVSTSTVQTTEDLEEVERIYPTRSRSVEPMTTTTSAGSPIRSDNVGNMSSIILPSDRKSSETSPVSNHRLSITNQTPESVSRVTYSTVPPTSGPHSSPHSGLHSGSTSPLNRFLPLRESPRTSSKENTPTRPVSVLLKHGLLSFNDPDSDSNSEDGDDLQVRSTSSGERQQNQNGGMLERKRDAAQNEEAETVGDNTLFRQRVLSIAQERRHNSVGSSSPGNTGANGDAGLRRGQAHYRNLESENMELRLKLQQYREMNASEQEFTRIKVQLSRAEMRIDELTESLERKNAAIAQLSAERDAAVQKWEIELVELQKDVDELEKSAAKYDAEAVAKAAAEYPDFIPHEAGSSELIDSIQHLIEHKTKLENDCHILKGENSRLMTQCSSLTDQVVQLGEKVQHITSQNTRLSSEAADMALQNSELNETNSRLLAKNAQLTAQLTSVQAKLAHRESELAQREAELEERDSSLIKKETEHEKMKTEMRRLVDAHQQELDSTMESLSSKHVSEKRALRHEIDLLSHAMADKSRELQEYHVQQKHLLEKEEALRREMDDRTARLQEIIHESKNASYLIIREFFGQIFEIMGAEYQEDVELQIEDIVKRSKQESRSKIPLLTELLIQHTRKLGLQAARSANSQESGQRIWELEREIQALQSIVDTVWTKAGADQVLVAQLKDLKRKLKLEEEKRKSDWIEYQRVLHQHQNPAQVPIPR